MQEYTLQKKGGKILMKKIISILLAVVMCFTMTTVAFAAEEESEDVSKDGIISVLLEAAKIASGLNDEARAALSEELEKLLIEQIAGNNPALQGAAEWLLDKILGLSGADNILDIDKEKAETIADLLMKMYDGDLADAVSNPILKIVISIIPEEVMREAVVWILSDGFGDALQDFIDKYGDGEGTTPPVEEEPEEDFFENLLGTSDILTIFTAAFQALKDIVSEVVDAISVFFNNMETAPEVAA